VEVGWFRAPRRGTLEPPYEGLKRLAAIDQVAIQHPLEPTYEGLKRA